MKYDSQKLSWKQLISAFKASSWFFFSLPNGILRFCNTLLRIWVLQFNDAEMIRGLFGLRPLIWKILLCHLQLIGGVSLPRKPLLLKPSSTPVIYILKPPVAMMRGQLTSASFLPRPILKAMKPLIFVTLHNKRNGNLHLSFYCKMMWSQFSKSFLPSLAISNFVNSLNFAIISFLRWQKNFFKAGYIHDIHSFYLCKTFFYF